MSEEFLIYTFPMLVLAAMIAVDNIATEIKLTKLERRVAELERDKEARE